MGRAEEEPHLAWTLAARICRLAASRLAPSDPCVELGKSLRRLATPEEQAPPLGLHLIVGPGARTRFENLLSGLEDGNLRAVVMMAKVRK